MDNPSDEAIAGDKALAEAWNEWRTMIDATECFNKPMEIAFAAGWRAAHARTIDQCNPLVEALEDLIAQCHDTERELTERYYGVFYAGESIPLVNARQALTQIRSGQ